MIPAWVENTRLLLRLLWRDPDRIASCLAKRSSPLAGFAEFAANHSLSAVTAYALEGTSLRDQLPADGMQRLEKRRDGMVAHAAGTMASLERLADEFSQVEQPFLLLKGPYLADRLYGSPQGREYFDLDVLVPLADRNRALNRMTECGYDRRSGVLLHRGLTCYFVHGFDFARADTKVDLHWCLSSHPSIRLTDSSIWKHIQTYALGGRSYHVLSDEHELIFACLSLLRDIERGRAKLKNVVDLLQLVEAMDARTDWYAFIDARRADGTHTPCVRVITLCLRIADGQDWWPRLRAALGNLRPRRHTAALGAEPLRFPPLPMNLGNKLWAMRAYDTAAPAWFAWWAASLPFRIAAHRQGASAKPATA